MRIYIWHGYLLSGTGSNEYSRALAEWLAKAGHDVTVFCQDDLALPGVTTVRTPLPGRLPVFVLDRYAGIEPALIGEMPRAELQEFVDAQAAAMRAHGPADLVIANHVVLGAPVGVASGMPFVVKAHGSELEYAMRTNADLTEWARQTLPAARAVIAGSEHIARVLAEIVGLDPATVTIIPPGVDTAEMRPRPREEALAGLLAEAAADPANPAEAHNERLPDADNARRLADFFADPAPTVLYVGKLSREKGVHLLIEALGRGVQSRSGRARALIVGFGPERANLERQARELGVEALFTGPLQHRHLRFVWNLVDASIAPSVFPEAFGMVAAEAAACGCPPVVARHSGLAEIAAGIEAEVPVHLRLVGVPTDDAAALAARLHTLLNLGTVERDELRAGARRAVVANWSWANVAASLAALGEPVTV